jgi:hypothetical protein
MKGKHEKSSGWRKLLVLSLTVMMAVMFMPANALAEGTNGNAQSAVSSSQSVDKGSTGTGDTGAAAAEQNNEEKEIDQGAEKAIQLSSEQQNQLTAAGNSSETVTEETANNNSDVPEYLRTQIENERKVAFDSDDEASIGGTSYKTIGQALNEAKDGDTITLLRDVNRDFEITTYSETDTTKIVRSINRGGIYIRTGKNITLNLNAHQVMTSEENGHKYSIKVASGSTVRIVNQPTSERQEKLKTIDPNAVQETQREVGGKAVLSSGIINEGTVTLDNTQGKINLNGSGYAFYNSGSLTLKGNYNTGYSPEKIWMQPLTLSIVEQNKDANVSFGNGFNADSLIICPSQQVLDKLNQANPEKTFLYTLVRRGNDHAWDMLQKSDAIQGLSNKNVQLKKLRDGSILLVNQGKETDPEDQAKLEDQAKPDDQEKSDDQTKPDIDKNTPTMVYLNGGKDGQDNPEHQGLGRGLLSGKPVKTFDEAKRVYYEALAEGYTVKGIEIDGTVSVSDEESWNSAQDNKADSKTDVEGKTDKDSSGDNGTAVKRGASESASGSSDSGASDAGKQDQGKAARPIQIVRGSELTGNLIQVSSKGSLTLEDIVIDGNQENAKTTTKSLIQVFDEGTLNIKDGAVLKNNTLTDRGYFHACGGAVNVNGGTLNMKGGTIENNTAVIGGGIYVYGTKAVINMSNGSIRGNHAVNGTDSDSLAAGGGVDVYDGAVMYFSGGTIESNSSAEIGGGISVGTMSASNNPETLYMTGGNIDGNSGGNIDGNSAGSGGGGIFVQAGTRGAAGKAVVSGGAIFNNKMTGEGTGNKAFGGGGIYVNGYSASDSGFESGQLILTNALVYDNFAAIAGGGYAACPVSHTHIYVKNGAAFYSNRAEIAKEIYILASTAYGIHSGNPTYIISESMFGGNPYHWKYDDNTEVPLNRLSGQLRAIYSESLNLHTDETPGENARTQARVQIYENTSATRGGGIGSNGTVTIGEEGTTKVTAQKKWDDDNQSAKRPGSIQVQLFRSTKSDLSDKQYIGYITLTPDKDGNWTNTAEFKNLAKTDASGNEYIYTVGEKKMDGYDATVTQDEKTKDFTITNKPSQTPPTPTPSPTYHHVTVQKVWKLDDGRTRPDSVQVQLMKNGTAYGQPVTLNDANNWTCTWDGLADDSSTWTVQEVIVPNGFKTTQQVTAETNGSKVTITNDDTPVKPNKPNSPTKPNKTVNPKTPSSNKTVNPKTPSIQHTTVQNTPSTPASAPQTSDQTRLGTDLILFGGAAALLALLLAVKRRKVSK